MNQKVEVRPTKGQVKVMSFTPVIENGQDSEAS
jgi:hypothetical protein